MKRDIKQYINSGVLEAYIIGAATPAEENEILQLKTEYPEVKQALRQLEDDFENMAKSMAIEPPPGTWYKIEADIDGLIAREQTLPKPFSRQQNKTIGQDNAPQYIEVEGESTHMKIHKNWKWVFAAVFILGKIFLGCAIYFYLENRQAQQQLKELKQEIQFLKK